MDILAVQQRLIDNGFQFIEHIYNDELSTIRNCYITMTKNNNPGFSFHHATNRELNIDEKLSWGRYNRMYCWRLVAEWLDIHYPQ